MTTAVHKKEKRSQTVSAVWFLFSFSFGFISSTLLLCRQPSDLLPVLREEIAEHAAHSEHKADGKAGHNIAAVYVPGNQPGARNPHGPQHQEVDDSRETDLSHPVYETDNPVKYRIGPRKRQDDPYIPDRDVEHRRVSGEEFQKRPAPERHDQSGDTGDQAGKQRDLDSAFL